MHTEWTIDRYALLTGWWFSFILSTNHGDDDYGEVRDMKIYECRILPLLSLFLLGPAFFLE